MMSERHLARLGWAASIMAMAMYLSYIDQIRLNLSGAKGSLVLPMATILNCVLWLSYGYFREKRDWPIVLANAPGVVLGAAALITAL